MKKYTSSGWMRSIGGGEGVSVRSRRTRARISSNVSSSSCSSIGNSSSSEISIESMTRCRYRNCPRLREGFVSIDDDEELDWGAGLDGPLALLFAVGAEMRVE